MQFETCRVIPAAHPALAGHFPGNPIVPGVVILDEVVQAMADWQPNRRLCGAPSVKFLAPLRPAQGFTIRLADPGSGRVRFECLREDGQLVAQGVLMAVSNPPELQDQPDAASTSDVSRASPACSAAGSSAHKVTCPTLRPGRGALP